ncbi:MAG TPA: anaerobic ribonucleoside-triphosphate reductase activating protein [Clostridiales bacterium]|nr:anaerobic ribonucleoside-triphosphate reductase activating protein [Clostridiales bacterium]
MNYCNVKNCDIANGVGVRVSLFVSGCRNRCKNCFQPETWDFNYGKPFDEQTEEKLMKMLAPSYINGLTVLGGEPMEPENQRALLPFLKKVKAAYPQKTIWLYTGFTLEELRSPDCRAHTEYTEEILKLLTVLVDGRFIEEKKNISLRFRGSENQRLIDVAATLAAGSVTLWDK